MLILPNHQELPEVEVLCHCERRPEKFSTRKPILIKCFVKEKVFKTQNEGKFMSKLGDVLLISFFPFRVCLYAAFVF